MDVRKSWNPRSAPPPKTREGSNCAASWPPARDIKPQPFGCFINE
jgi:hypothetical protein